MIKIEIIAKFLSIIKIPLKYLIPAIFIVCCVFTFSPDAFLANLGVLSIKKEFQSSIGTALIISASFIVVYGLYYLVKWINKIIFNLTYKQRSIKKIANLNDYELRIIFNLYFSDGYCGTVDYNNPITQGLLSRKFIYTGSSQAVSVDWNNKILMNAALQPFVYQSLDRYFQKLSKQEEKLEKKLKMENDETRKKKINKKLDDLYNKPLVKYIDNRE